MNPDLRGNASLSDWLNWQESAHVKPIDLGLDRVSAVYSRLNIQSPPITLTVAGTNGKGSSVSMLASIYSQAGYRTGAYTTPHLLRYNERIRVDQKSVTDPALCDAFAQIDAARGDISLSYFEFGTLAALFIFDQQQVDLQILEVGLGGRLDAVNIIDADAALISTIDLDHADWLGTDRSQIAFEKAGVFRRNQIAVCSDPSVPDSLFVEAERVGAELTCAGRDFSHLEYDSMHWRHESSAMGANLYANPVLKGRHQFQNAAGVVELVQRMQPRLPVSQQHIDQGLQSCVVDGRLQQLESSPNLWLDVAHNPESARALARFLECEQSDKRVIAVFGVMADKDIEQILSPLINLVSHWCLCDLPVSRAASAHTIEQKLKKLDSMSDVTLFADVQLAVQTAKSTADPEDCIVVFGSFYLAEACLRAL